MRDGSQQPALADRTVAAMTPALAAAQLRLTRHRSAVLAALESSDRPLTAEEVVLRSAVPTSTAYRNLAELVDAGVVTRVAGVTGGERHELAEPFSHRHHHHLVCTVCGIVTDFDPSRQLERLIDREVAELAARSGFDAVQHVFDVRGTCGTCRAAR